MVILKEKNWQRKKRRGLSIEDLKTINMEFKIIEKHGTSFQKYNKQLGCYTSGDSAQATQKSNAQIGRARYNKTLARARNSNRLGDVLTKSNSRYWFDALLDYHAL